MAVSLGHKHQIRVNAVSPGWISVDNENAEADENGTKWEDGMTEGDHKWHPAGRVGKVEDIYQSVKFLAESDFVTGQEVVVDGGVTKKMVYPE
jgi:NAD(P)-dependent dehydrogenase (short-subunit alcohol dehydrogenase family)